MMSLVHKGKGNEQRPANKGIFKIIPIALFVALLLWQSNQNFPNKPQPLQTKGDSDNTADDRSKNEQIYDSKYWQWQASMNQFGAAYKGDIIRFLLGKIPTSDSALKQPRRTILEFGCSGGYIINSMPDEYEKYGVEINPSSRAYAQQTFPSLKQVFTRIEDMPDGLLFDVIYTTSVLEHVDCPLCELRKMKSKLKSTGVMIVGLKNDGADHASQTFAKKASDPNHHIYTWNALLLANMLESAGFTPCNSVGQFEAWHAIDLSLYEKDKRAYCEQGLRVGKTNNVHNLWSISIMGEGDCRDYEQSLNEILNCRYLSP